jgi:hypothetical protein
MALAALLALAGCTNPRANRDPGPDPERNAPAGNEPAPDRPGAPRSEPPRALLETAYSEGQRFRTTRTFEARETTKDDVLLTDALEVTLTEVLETDERGRLLRVRRSFERSENRFGSELRPREVVRGSLEGVTLELARVSGAQGPRVEARVVAGEASLGQKFVLEGFDAALLPVGETARGARWVVTSEELEGLKNFIRATGFVIEKSTLACVLSELGEAQARIVVDWSLTGSFDQRPAVMDFRGALVFDRALKLVREFTLEGGRQGLEKPQIRMTVRRAVVEGYLDLRE